MEGAVVMGGEGNRGHRNIEALEESGEQEFSRSTGESGGLHKGKEGSSSSADFPGLKKPSNALCPNFKASNNLLT